jgi:hypothetical protein
MDAPIASLMIEGFCKGYEKQAKKEEKEAEEIVNTINSDALKALCTRYDNKTGEFPEYAYVGASVFKFFEKLKAGVEEKDKNQNEVKEDGKSIN